MEAEEREAKMKRKRQAGLRKRKMSEKWEDKREWRRMAEHGEE